MKDPQIQAHMLLLPCSHLVDFGTNGRIAGRTCSSAQDCLVLVIGWPRLAYSACLPLSGGAISSVKCFGLKCTAFVSFRVL